MNPSSEEWNELRPSQSNADTAFDPAPGGVNGTRGATVVSDGNLELTEDARMDAAVNVRGHLRIGPRAVVSGDATVDGDAEAREAARVLGTLHVRGALRWNRDAAAEHVTAEGPFITADGQVRATGLTARNGVRPLANDQEARFA